MGMFLYDKHFFAPYFIFIKIGENIDYNEVLNRLGLRNVEEIEFKPTHQNPKEVYVTRCKNWVHVMDNWFYDLYHSNLFSTITQLNTEGYDIYRCSIGDSDNSYAFSWYRKGVLVREFTYDDMKGRVIRDIGPPLEGEKEKHHKKTIEEIVMSIAILLGIDTEHQLENIKAYTYDVLEKDKK